jgi:hypothetical protein
MVALNIRDIGDGRKAALDAEAKGVPVSELVRRLLDEGIERSRSVRAQQEWLLSAREGLAFEARELRKSGPAVLSR